MNIHRFTSYDSQSPYESYHIGSISYPHGAGIGLRPGMLQLQRQKWSRDLPHQRALASRSGFNHWDSLLKMVLSWRHGWTSRQFCGEFSRVKVGDSLNPRVGPSRKQEQATPEIQHIIFPINIANLGYIYISHCQCKPVVVGQNTKISKQLSSLRYIPFL